MPTITHCPACGFMVEPDWDTCRFCRFDLAAARDPLADPAAAPPHAPPPFETFAPPPLTPPPPPPPAPAPARVPRFVPIAAVVLLGVVGVSVYALASRSSGPAHPDAWDPRVTDLVDFVESKRGGAFDHPVYVDFLSEAEYSDATRTDEADLTADDKAEFDRQEGFFRALGLAAGDVDLFAASNDVSDTGTLAFYDPSEKRVRVRGTSPTLGADLRVTLVHELTHAWQDQHFDVAELQQDAETTGADDALRTLLEGDAVRVENLYIDTLTDADRQAYEDTIPADVTDAGLGDVPDALIALFSAPYALGPPFLQVLEADGGTTEIDGAFRKPPTTDEQVLDPLFYLDGDAPKDVATPRLDKGDEETDSGDFGALAWFLVLAERTDPAAALRAVDGWGGDSFVTWDESGRVCARLDFVGDTDRDTEEMAAQLDTWAAAMPPGTATVERSAGMVELQTCDPGADSDLTVTGNGSQALAIPTIRSYVEAGALFAGLDRDQAACSGAAFIEGYSVDELADPNGPPGFEDKLSKVYASCGTG